MPTLVPLRPLAPALASTLGRLGVSALLGSILAGCIADTAEDTELPWASSKSWEGMAPIAPAVMDRYD